MRSGNPWAISMRAVLAIDRDEFAKCGAERRLGEGIDVYAVEHRLGEGLADITQRSATRIGGVQLFQATFRQRGSSPCNDSQAHSACDDLFNKG